MRTIIPFNELKIVHVTNHWDIPLKGYCMYEGKLAMFETHDDTDYEEMHLNCPYCSDDSTDDDDCNCENYVDVICFITPLTLQQRTRARIRKWWFETCVVQNGKYKSLHLRQLYYFTKCPTWNGFVRIFTGNSLRNG